MKTPSCAEKWIIANPEGLQEGCIIECGALACDATVTTALKTTRIGNVPVPAPILGAIYSAPTALYDSYYVGEHVEGSVCQNISEADQISVQQPE